MRYWIAVAGTKDHPLDNDWRIGQAVWNRAQGHVQMFSGRPTIRISDRLVIYASGSPGRFRAGRFFAVREVVSDPCRADTRGGRGSLSSATSSRVPT